MGVSNEADGENYMSPVIIIGAPRSGTNMLRDVLCKVDGISTWPCDEINYIWRFGNSRFETDEFTAAMATERTSKYIRRAFTKLAGATSNDIVLEKTCANSLRVGFVDEIFPQCKYIYIVRDGVDVVGSSAKRWAAKLDLKYLIKKARYVPASDVAYYAIKYLKSRVHKVISKQGILSVWGPKFEGLRELPQDIGVQEVCAHQWKQCVKRSEEAFNNICSSRVLKVKYESFVENPANELERIFSFLALEVDKEKVLSLTGGISSASVGKGRLQLAPDEIEKIESIAAVELKAQGYL